MKPVKHLFLTLALLLLCFPSPARAMAWEVFNKWDKPMWDKYSQWWENWRHYKKNGTTPQKASKFDRFVFDPEMNLLNNPEWAGQTNPQVSKSDALLLRSLTHCGNYPMLAMIYFSYRMGLPCIVSKIKMTKGWDIRYSHGNHPVGRTDSVSHPGPFREFLLDADSGRKSGYNFVSGNFRTAPGLEKTDSVPAAPDKRFVRPGTICYNANGHVLVVGKVDESGEVHFLDAHPDNSITFNQTLSAIPRVNKARLGPGGFSRCYDGFRVPRLVKLVNGRAEYFTNEEMLDFGFSVEQYKLMAKLSEKGELKVKGRKAKDFPGLIKAILQTKREKPLEYLAMSAEEWLGMMVERRDFVRDAWKDVTANGPITFPNDTEQENIYQANGRWERWSSPSSDVDRRRKYFHAAQGLAEMAAAFDPQSQVYDYEGFTSREELVRAMLELKKKLFSELSIVYENTGGQEVSLCLAQIEERLFDLSFDPNHCPELRWGAPPNSPERQGMKLISTPLLSGGSMDALTIYEAEKGLRYYPTRQTVPTSLDPTKNPDTPPFQLIETILAAPAAGEEKVASGGRGE